MLYNGAEEIPINTRRISKFVCALKEVRGKIPRLDVVVWIPFDLGVGWSLALTIT